ncbi:NAD(P)/FAD-dependent oxidoreductase [Trinickia dinghuensis]|uniref:Pyridine nucleotide-disulfide oxidoreductase n=1 Tax=Trinickia dinghuensis TaxID=2291023 RepID=A0A3D8JX92_9BURK|nr:FAD-dependent oxidoreductase [Trinickia dinghuensis]RDU97738.1 pyridine nucleotide-disulfide oxidoreductase [Trinickia dinghuensis]
MSDDRVMAIVGAGHVGGRAAQTLREAGWRGGIALIGAEPHLPYERPPLSKAVLTDSDEAAILPLRSRDAWREDAIDHLIASVRSLDTAERVVRLHDGREIRYESLLIATGGHARNLTIPGADSPGVFRLRTLDDALKIKPRLRPEARVVVIGGGFIGLEVAASARTRGCNVVVVEGGSRLLGRAVPATIAAHAQALHERNGVQCLLGSAPNAIEPLEDGTLAVMFGGKERLVADTVIVGIGIQPADELARAAGIQVDRGIIVGETLETSAPNVYAAGDVALFPSRFGTHRIRQETWHNAETQSRLAARNMLGEREAYRELPWFWSDQYDHQLQVAGEPALGRQSVVRTLAGGAQIHFELDANGGLVAASGFGLTSALAKEMRVARMLVERSAAVTPGQLSNVEVKLKGLL